MAATSINIRDFRKEIPGTLSDDKMQWNFPIIESINKIKNIMQYTVVVKLYTVNAIKIEDEYFDNKPMPGNIHGHIIIIARIKDGKIRAASPTIVKSGKNKGKANETNVFCQTLRDALSIYNKHLKKANLHINISESGRFPPMLAQILKDPAELDYSKAIYIQRKYNGVRAVCTQGADKKTWILYSRGMNDYPGFDHITADLAPIIEQNPGIYLDGELYNPNIPLQDIAGNSRNSKIDHDLSFYIYDLFFPENIDLTMTERLKILQNLKIQSQNVVIVETFLVKSAEEIQKYFKQFIDEKFEGAIIRLDTPYEYSWNNHHTKNMLKMKPRFDAEFEIVDFTRGLKGKGTDMLIFVCKTEAGDHFNVNVAMPIEKRIELYKKMDEKISDDETYFQKHYLGKKLIVFYDELSKSGVPLRATTEGTIRTWE
ncbi:MAG: ATP-dependent DNA ligase [Acidimicrobiales bacterium]